MTEEEECAGKVVAHSITPNVLERFEAAEVEHALLACEKSRTMTSGLTPTDSITVFVLVPRPCITIGDPPDQALQEIFHTELCAEAGITIGELRGPHKMAMDVFFYTCNVHVPRTPTCMMRTHCSPPRLEV